MNSLQRSISAGMVPEVTGSSRSLPAVSPFADTYHVSAVFHLHPVYPNAVLRFVYPRFVSLYKSDTRTGAHGIVVVKALCYKPEGRVFDSR
jgi:hypothetical protein